MEPTETTEINGRLTAVKFRTLKNKKQKSYRTLTLAQELRRLGKDFEFQSNTIVLPLPPKTNRERKRTLFITGALSCYRCRVDVWEFVNGGDFTYFELTEKTGRAVLYKLIAGGFLDDSFAPGIPPYCQALIEKL